MFLQLLKFLQSQIIFNLSSILSQDVAAYIKKEFDKKHNPTW